MIKNFIMKDNRSNGRLWLRVRVMFLLLYSELAPTDRDATCSMTLLERKVHQEVM